VSSTVGSKLADSVRWIGAMPGRYAPFRGGSFTSPVHHETPAAWLGVALGVTFGICFATGLLSHLIQHASLRSESLFTAGGWTGWLSRPVGLYRVTEGLHVVAGLAAIPLLLAKLFVIYHHLWAWPPVKGVRHAVERVLLLPLVAGALFLLVTGVQNIAYWYAWDFFFPTAHYWAGWITIGALLIHIFAKAHIVRRVFGGRARAPDADSAETQPRGGGLTRRSVLTATGATSGLVVLTSAGQTVPGLGRIAVLAPRQPSTGPQGFPVNKTAEGVGVTEAAMNPRWALRVAGNVDRELMLTRADLEGMPQTEPELPIACVEGWSASARWQGVALRSVLDAAGAPSRAFARLESLQSSGLYTATMLTPTHTGDPVTLLALYVNGGPLDIDHGFPARLIAPNNPGVMQTKWLGTVTVL
jgi:DMSO/TMAO reductase YedYZ molybdopterin-dependent catalytic subunit